MDVGKIRKYAELMQEMDLTVLEIKEDTETIHLERGRVGLVPAVETVGTKESGASAPVAASSDVAGASSGDGKITSPMVGMFYVAPAEDADPFVQVGDKVKAGDTVCIIEAMKLMNEIVADQDGVITEILATNGTIVEFGQPLFSIRKE